LAPIHPAFLKAGLKAFIGKLAGKLPGKIGLCRKGCGLIKVRRGLKLLPGDMLQVGVLMNFDESEPVAKARVSAFTQALAGLGWTDGRNVRMDLRWYGDDINRSRALAQELVGLQPDIIVTSGYEATAAVQRETRTIPIVFANAGDPVASGIVARLDRPSGNITGFANLEAPLGGKWLELLSVMSWPGAADRGEAKNGSQNAAGCEDGLQTKMKWEPAASTASHSG
jgi:hypothetical protein